MALTELQIKTSKSKAIRYVVSNGRGLALEVCRLVPLLRDTDNETLHIILLTVGFPIPPFTIHDLRPTGSTILHKQSSLTKGPSFRKALFDFSG
jgi:hypothetical protein